MAEGVVVENEVKMGSVLAGFNSTNTFDVPPNSTDILEKSNGTIITAVLVNESRGMGMSIVIADGFFEPNSRDVVTVMGLETEHVWHIKQEVNGAETYIAENILIGLDLPVIYRGWSMNETKDIVFSLSFRPEDYREARDIMDSIRAAEVGGV